MNYNVMASGGEFLMEILAHKAKIESKALGASVSTQYEVVL